MGEKIELNMIFDRALQLPDALEHLFFMAPFEPTEIFCIDDWQYTAKQAITNFDLLDQKLETGKIAVIYGIICGKSAGIYAEKKSGCYCYHLWFEASLLPEHEIIIAQDSHCAEAFRLALVQVTQLYPCRLLLAGLGIETLFDFDGSLKDAVDNAFLISVWYTDKKTAQQLGLAPHHFIELM